MATTEIKEFDINNGTFSERVNDPYSFRDLSLTIVPNLKKDVQMLKGVQCINQSLMNVFLSDDDDRLFDPTFAFNIKQYLFAPAVNQTIADVMKKQIEWFIPERFEQRIEILEVNVNAEFVEQYGYTISIFYFIKDIEKEATFSQFFESLR